MFFYKRKKVKYRSNVQGVLIGKQKEKKNIGEAIFSQNVLLSTKLDERTS